VCNVRWRG